MLYRQHFDVSLGLLLDRSVITWRRVENHQSGCPEVPGEPPGPVAPDTVPAAAPPQAAASSAAVHPASAGQVRPPVKLVPAPPPGPPPAAVPAAPPGFPFDVGPQGPPPVVPVCQKDAATSPADVGTATFVGQVLSAEVFLLWCRQTIDNFESYMANSQPADQDRIRECLRELSDKVRTGERVKAMGEVSLEVACYFGFGVIASVT